eukprot:jgi/Chrpa1/11304/Chrysochromulina_OHIO_Genome00003988-RA
MPLPPELNRGASNEWFDVRSEELLRVHDELEAWRRDISQPLQLDIFVDATDEPMMRGALGMHAEEPTRVLLERWRLHYDPHDAPATQVALKPIYKRFMVLLRALLAQLRLLPTYRLASSLAKLRGSHAGSLLQYDITLPRSEAGIAAARSRGFAAGARQYSFPPPDTKEKHGKLEIELLYRPETLFAGRTPTPSSAVFCDAAAVATAAATASGGGARSAAGALIGTALIPDYVPVGDTPSCSPRASVSGVICRPRQTSADHELPFMMDDEDEALEEIPADAFSRFGSGRRRSSISGPRLSGDADDQVDEAAIGSLMMEVSAARPLQLFGSRDGRASPLSRSIDDISLQLDRLSRTFHGAQMPPSMPPVLAGSAAAASLPVMAGPFGATLAPAAAPTSAPAATTISSESAPPARDSTEALLARSGGALFPFAPTLSEE